MLRLRDDEVLGTAANQEKTSNKEYKSLKHVDEEDNEWLDNFYKWMLLFRHKIYNLSRKTEREANGYGKASTKSNSSKS